MWARKPNNKLAKQFCKVLYSTSTEEWLGASYRQSALIPTCDAPKIKSCTVIIHAGYTTEIRVPRWGYHKTTLDSKDKCYNITNQRSEDPKNKLVKHDI